ncbi:hypothetical protein Q5692_27545 [Microcoleus sp. C2C3]|uniref:hypothetical protein n=1 Tax=unclassified Microcoleus TaxID=2642155 RepID=UPI002FCEF27B
MKRSNRAGLRSLYILLHEVVYLRLPTYINSGNTGMMGSRESSVGECGIIDRNDGESGVGSRPLGNVELLTGMMGSRESGVVRWGMWNY